MAKMNQSGAFYLMVDIDPKAVEGNLLGHLVVFYDMPDSRHRVNERISKYLGDQIAFLAMHDTYHVGQLAYVRKALGLPGVVG